MLFSKDSRLTSTMRERMTTEGAVISSNNGTQNDPVYNYVIKINPYEKKVKFGCYLT